MEFGKWLKRELSERNISMTAFAQDVRVSPGTVSRWVSGQRRPEHELCERIAMVLDYDLDFVLVQAGHESYPKARQEQLRLELAHAESRAVTVDIELEHLTREREELTQQIERLYSELAQLGTTHHRDPTEETLEAIDRLPLSERVKDQLRQFALDKISEENRSTTAADGQ